MNPPIPKSAIRATTLCTVEPQPVIVSIMINFRHVRMVISLPFYNRRENALFRQTLQFVVIRNGFLLKFETFILKLWLKSDWKLVDQNEECDCGFEDDCKKVGDNCCYPADHPEKRLRCKRKTDPRTRRPFQCSPSEGPCCESATCSFKLGINCFLLI